MKPVTPAIKYTFGSQIRIYMLRNVRNRSTRSVFLRRYKFVFEEILVLCYATRWRQFSYKHTNDFDWLNRSTKILYFMLS